MLNPRWVLPWIALAAIAAACSDGTTSASPTAKTSTSTPARTATVAKATSTPAASPKATGTTVATPTLPASIGPIESAERCFTENERVRNLELPRQITSLTPARVSDGDTVTFNAVGFQPNSALEIRIFIPGTDRISQALTQLLSDSSGQASGSFVIPSVRMLNATGDNNVPVCIAVALWSPTQVAGATLLVVPE
jgi:hypothetical protein